MNNLPPEEVTWDVVTGISAGSINAGAIATYAVGDEKPMAEYLLSTAQSLKGSDIYRSWPLGALEGIISKTGIYDSSPILSFLESHLGNGTTDRKLVVGATSYNSGKLVTWNETSPVDVIAVGIKASSSIPGAFDATIPKSGPGAGQVFGDGGVKQGVNILDGIARCLETTPDAKNIIVDVILCDGETIQPVDPNGDHTYVDENSNHKCLNDNSHINFKSHSITVLLRALAYVDEKGNHC